MRWSVSSAPASVVLPAVTVTDWRVPASAVTTTGCPGTTPVAAAAGAKVTVAGGLDGVGPIEEPGSAQRAAGFAPAALVQPATAEPAATPTTPVTT